MTSIGLGYFGYSSVALWLICNYKQRSGRHAAAGAVESGTVVEPTFGAGLGCL